MKMYIGRKLKKGVVYLTLIALLSSITVGVIPGFINNSVAAATIQPGDYQQDNRVRLNSLGYFPNQDKKATIAASCSTFHLVQENGTVAYTGTTTSMSNSDTSEQVYIADFSSVTAPGTYFLAVPGVGKSVNFKIANDVYLDAYKTSMLGMYLWRCGTSVSANYKGQTFSHAACHTNDGYLDPITGAHTKKDGTKGWHDAGDYNKYVVNAGVTLGSMFMAWEHFQDAVKAIPLVVPENSNSMPDYLDEIKFEIDWLLTMQYPDGSGKVSHKLTTKSFGGFIMPEQENTERFFTQWGSAATADFVAMTAMAARIFKPYDVAYAEKCLNAAKLSYAFLKANPSNVPANLNGFSTGDYQTTDTDDRLWAAAEMWETTGDAAYLTDFESRAKNESIKVDQDFDWGNVKNLGMYTYVLSSRTGKNQDLSDTIKNAMVTTANAIVTARNTHGYGRPLGTVYYWGCNGSVARQTMTLQVANKLAPNKAYINTALDALGHLFGRNYYNRSFVTGLGINPPMNPHDRRAGGDNIKDPWPGYLVGGGFPSGKDWVDIQDSYQTNEIAINWNGALIYALAGFIGTQTTTSPSPTSTNTPTPTNTPAPTNTTRPTDPTFTYTLSGYIAPDFEYDEAAASSVKAGFKVEMAGSGGYAFTDANGYFELKNIGRGAVIPTLRISKKNYLTRDILNVSVSSDKLLSTAGDPIRMWAGDMLISGAQDNAVNMADIMEVARAFGSVPGDGRYDADTDLNKDGAINMSDIMIVAKHFNATITSYPPLGTSYTPTPTVWLQSTPTKRPTETPTNVPVNTPTNRPTNTPLPTIPGGLTENNDDWLHVEGNVIKDLQGNPVWLTGANWFGYNTGTGVFDGVWSCNMRQALDGMANRGINFLRIPISTQLILEWASGVYPKCNVNDFVNPELKGLNSLQVFDEAVKMCKENGMKIMMDIHSAKTDAMGHIYPVWYNGTYTTESFYKSLEWLAERYKNDDTILAYDLKNEPHGKPGEANMAKWDGSKDINNWKYAAEEAGKRILAINPHALIVVEGVEVYPKPGFDYTAVDEYGKESKYYFNWWGGNLRGVKDHPVNLGSGQKQLVYSPHDYGPLVWRQPWFYTGFNKDTLYKDCWRDNWGFIHEQNIAPLLMGEWGGFMDGGDNEKWMESLRDYMKDKYISHTFWCYNANSGDTGGLVSYDFITWDEAKYALLKSSLWQDKDGRFVGLDHKRPLGVNGKNTNVTEYYKNGGTPPVAK